MQREEKEKEEKEKEQERALPPWGYLHLCPSLSLGLQAERASCL